MFIAISLFTFVAINLIGNPVELATARVQFAKDTVQATLLRQYGLTDSQGREIPVWKRYLNWIYDFIHGDMGQSYEKFPSEVTDNLGNFLWETLKMQVLALVLAFTISVVIGILAAYFHKTPADSIISAVALLGLSMPIFVSGILAIIIFTGTGLQWFPAAGAHSLPQLLVADGCLDCARPPDVIWDAEVSTNWTDPAWWSMFVNVWWIYSKDSVRHIVLPVATLTFATMATFARLTRSTMLEIMRQDYILAARANGLSEYTIVRKHALKNVLLPLVTFLGLSIGGLLIGAPITETVFSFPGLGNYFLASLVVLDVPIIMALTMIITLMILFSNLAADIAYTYLDPRIAL
ncbi:MAG: ABC transporter permease [Candidatus Heimdallarchaeota archaeon]|nr:ABC transporter permease [Candidatus Heimdallarchaeota archaeon]